MAKDGVVKTVGDATAAEDVGPKKPLAPVFKQFDTSGDGFLDIGELKRAFRAIGLEKRTGVKFELDQKTFNAFDTNKDGKVSLEEFEENIHPKTRAAIEAQLVAGWVFDADKWAASKERHSKIDMSKVFKQFDTDSDGVLDIREMQRAFRAIGLKKRDGSKMEVDLEMFNSFDTNKDGKVSLAEFEANLHPKTRAKIEAELNANWVFDPAKWAASQERHSKIDMSKVFKQFDTDSDGVLDIREMQRAFRAIGLKKRDGSKMEVDLEMFNSFDTNKDGKVSLAEFEANLKDKTRAKIEAEINGGWVFDDAKWKASIDRHAADGSKVDPAADAALAAGELAPAAEPATEPAAEPAAEEAAAEPAAEA